MLSATDSGSAGRSASARGNSAAMLQNIPDLMMSMAELDDDSVQQIRKTAESPPRVSVYDVLGAVTGYTPNNCVNLWQRLSDQFLEGTTLSSNFKFPGRVQEMGKGGKR